MNQDLSQTNQEWLQNLMRQVGIADLKELSQVAKVSRLQLRRIEQGLIFNVSVGAIAKIAQVLNVTVDDLLKTGGEKQQLPAQSVNLNQNDDALVACRQEYQKLQQEMSQLEESLQIKFQQASLATIESWMLQWPTAVAIVSQNPHLPAIRLLALVEPIERLVRHWNVSTIATVGEELAYDPQYHELMKGMAQPGELVKVRYVGYKQEDKLLHKAKVSPV